MLSMLACIALLACQKHATSAGAGETQWCVSDARAPDVRELRGCFATESACVEAGPAQLPGAFACRLIERPWCYTDGVTFACFAAGASCDAAARAAASARPSEWGPLPACRRAWPEQMTRD